MPDSHFEVVSAGRATGEDGLLSLSAAGRLEAVRIDGRPVSPAAISRWASRGRKSRSGLMVRLRTCRVGGRVATRASWIEEFVEALNDDPAGVVAFPAAGSDDVDAQLAALGV